MKAVILFFVLSLAVNSNAQSIQERLKPPLVAAHQGGYPWTGKNNTLLKFNQAIKDGTDIVEMDLQTTKDDVVIVYHDSTLDSHTKCTGNVKDATYEQIKSCPYDNGMPIEKFEDVLLNINGRAIVNAEFKTQEVVVPAIQLIQKYNAYDWVYFQTKSIRERYLLARSTDNRVALNYKAVNNDELNWALSLNDANLIVIEMEKDMATSANILRTHDANKLVSVNSWRYGTLEEIFSAACNKVFKLRIDIAVANRISGCVDQKKYYSSKQ